MGTKESSKEKSDSKERAFDTHFECTLLADGFHKIKNALGGIGGFATLLERELSPEDQTHRLVGRIQDGVAKVNDIVITLMTLVRDSQTRFRSVDLFDVIREGIAFLPENEKMVDENLKIEMENGSVRREWITDPNIFRNVVIHTMRFIDQCGSHLNRVVISSSSGQKFRVLFSYTNCGKHIPHEENIQEWIGSLDPIESRLSMAIVWKCVKELEGRLWFETPTKQEKTITIELGKGNSENGSRREKDTRPR